MADSVTVTPTPSVAPPVPTIVVQPIAWWQMLIGPAVMLAGFIAYESYRGGGPNVPTPYVATVTDADARAMRDGIIASYADAYLEADKLCQVPGTKLNDVMGTINRKATDGVKATGAANFTDDLTLILPESGEPNPAQMSSLGSFYRNLGTKLKKKGWFDR
jgi:hypothetical protein